MMSDRLQKIRVKTIAAWQKTFDSVNHVSCSQRHYGQVKLNDVI